MTPLGWGLTVAGAIVGILLLSLVSLLFGKTKFIAEYQNGKATLWLQWLFLKFKLFPRTKKKQKPTEKKPKKKSSVGTAAKRKLQKTVRAIPLKNYVTLLKIIVTDFLAKFHCKSFVLYASLGGDEANEIAMEYGTINALLYPVLGAFSAAGRLHKCDVQITPDFTSEETKAEGRAVFTFRLYQALGCVLKLSENLYD